MNEKYVHDLMSDSYNRLLSQKEIRFIFKISFHSRGKKVKITNLLLQINNIDMSVEELQSNVFFSVFVLDSNYFIVYKSTENQIILKLTEEGENIAERLEFDSSQIKTNTLPLRFINTTSYILKLIFKILIGAFILSFICLLLAPVFYVPLQAPMLYIFALLGAITAVIGIISREK